MKAIYKGKKPETLTDWTFYFEPVSQYSYFAGQFCDLIIDLKYPDLRSNVRTCSMSSSPTEKYLAFTFTIRDTGYKLSLMEMVEGEVVEITEPVGRMILETHDSEQYLMIAGGIGVAPYRSMLKYIHDTKINKNVDLLYSDKTILELAYWEEFEQFNLSNYLNIQYTLTRHKSEDGEWFGGTGRIDKYKMSEFLAEKYHASTIMICGPTLMVKSMLEIFRTLDLPRNKLLFELFTGY